MRADPLVLLVTRVAIAAVFLLALCSLGIAFISAVSPETFAPQGFTVTPVQGMGGYLSLLAVPFLLTAVTGAALWWSLRRVSARA